MASKSLEALEMLKNNISDYLDTIQNNEETISKTEFMFSCVYSLYELIKQDLERLGLIEALYNNTLKEMKTIKDDDRKLYLKFKDLEKENQNLKAFVDAYANARDELLIKNQYLEEENQKYLEELKRWGYPETPIHISKYKQLEIEHAKLKAKLYNLESHYELLENFTVPNLRKAIKILKDKYVDIELLLSSNSLEEYNHNYSIPLTQEEYDLLKEMLK